MFPSIPHKLMKKSEKSSENLMISPISKTLEDITRMSPPLEKKLPDWINLVAQKRIITFVLFDWFGYYKNGPYIMMLDFVQFFVCAHFEKRTKSKSSQWIFFIKYFSWKQKAKERSNVIVKYSTKILLFFLFFKEFILHHLHNTIQKSDKRDIYI